MALIKALKGSGFFSEVPIKVNGLEIVPLQFSSAILFKEWKLGQTEEELTVMKVIAEGTLGGKFKRIEYDLLDRYDEKTQMSSFVRACPRAKILKLIY